MVCVAFLMGFACCILAFCGISAIGKDLMRYDQRDKRERNRRTYER
jgi:hypothetical protein